MRNPSTPLFPPSPLSCFSASISSSPSPIVPTMPKCIQKVPTQLPPNKYLIFGANRRHSLAVDGVIWEGKERDEEGVSVVTKNAETKGGSDGVAHIRFCASPNVRDIAKSNNSRLITQRHSCQFTNSSSASTGAAVPAAQKGDGAVAIDSKIEKAMDLVKNLLIYAVRDEIELLRARIGNLEATVTRLEAENAILREHIPQDLLERIPLPQYFPPNALSSIAPIAQK